MRVEVFQMWVSLLSVTASIVVLPFNTEISIYLVLMAINLKIPFAGSK